MKSDLELAKEILEMHECAVSSWTKQLAAAVIRQEEARKEAQLILEEVSSECFPDKSMDNRIDEWLRQYQMPDPKADPKAKKALELERRNDN